jgi:hypothetical protein
MILPEGLEPSTLAAQAHDVAFFTKELHILSLIAKAYQRIRKNRLVKWISKGYIYNSLAETSREQDRRQYYV